MKQNLKLENRFLKAENTKIGLKCLIIALEKEHIKSADLASRVAQLEEENDYLQFRLDRIHNNSLWKATGGLRKCFHFVSRQASRLKNCGGLKGVVAKIKYKKREKLAMKNYGTNSFPNEEERRYEEEYAFEYRPLISILVPLYNTPQNFLSAMMGSVKDQTYKNWQLCLADGSDDH